jgi:hypothetical protein
MRIDHLKSECLGVARGVHGTGWLDYYPTNLVVATRHSQSEPDRGPLLLPTHERTRGRKYHRFFSNLFELRFAARPC